MVLFLLFACMGAHEPDPVDPTEPVPVAVASVDPPPPVPVVTPATDGRYAATQVLITWKGAPNAPATVTRSEADADLLVKQVYERSKTEDLSALAKELSDAPSGRRGGSIGVFLPDTMVPEVEAAVGKLEIGQIGEPVKSPFGWHILRRDEVVEARASMLLCAFQGAEEAQSLRPKDEAKARCDAALVRINAGEDFGAVAREVSDDPSAKSGGDIGLVGQGQMVLAFEDALFALKGGEHSGVIETPYGFHIVYRP